MLKSLWRSDEERHTRTGGYLFNCDGWSKLTPKTTKVCVFNLQSISQAGRRGFESHTSQIRIKARNSSRGHTAHVGKLSIVADGAEANLCLDHLVPCLGRSRVTRGTRASRFEMRPGWAPSLDASAYVTPKLNSINQLA